MLGTEVCAVLHSSGHTVLRAGLTRGEILQDLAEIDGTVNMIEQTRPDVVIHCAAYTNVDGAEQNPEQAFRVNALGTCNLAIACSQWDVPLCAISTDFVFDGQKGEPYLEWDCPHPINTYGASKLAGEASIREIWPKHWIVRTSWLYGIHGSCFPATILAKAEKESSLNVVTDQKGSPTYARDLAQALVALIQFPYYGTYHLSNAGAVTRYEFARRILEFANLEHVAINPIVSRDVPFRNDKPPARRPRNSALASTRSTIPGFGTMRPWEAALAEYVPEYMRLHHAGGIR
jgi:dTDP-4-dehydrorhamnose reductase